MRCIFFINEYIFCILEKEIAIPDLNEQSYKHVYNVASQEITHSFSVKLLSIPGGGLFNVATCDVDIKVLTGLTEAVATGLKSYKQKKEAYFVF